MATTTPVRVRGADRRLQIMQVARELFARQGFKGTTTRQIAERAKVNEAIIFRHFPRKQELYWAIIEHQTQLRGGHQALEARLTSGGSDHEIFAGIAEDILRRQAEDDSLTRLLFYCALENHKLSHRFFETRSASYFQAIAKFIRERAEAGIFRSLDPLLAARGFVGMVAYHSLVQDLFGERRFQDFDVKYVSRTLADIWLGGMLTREEAMPQKGPASL